MLLVIDIGNSNIVAGCFEGDRLVYHLRLHTDSHRTADEYESLLFGLLERNLPDGFVFNACVISSVVPPLTQEIMRLIARRTEITPLIVGPGIKTGMSIKTADPSAVGADRVVNALAARELYGRPVLAIDFGTATSFDYVDACGDYQGGIIAPGLSIALDSLVEHTAKLPRIELVWPERVVGKSTVEAMQSGTVIGYLALVDGLIERVKREVAAIDCVVATGGLGELISRESAHINYYDPLLTLKGMKILAGVNGVY
ncbi:MAG: type III pantothenate kinase [Candidatus Dadabacteria bacterium]|nr:MAG: type III pantothenate kinase [Candidatus Dadabacteria bacterium]